MNETLLYKDISIILFSIGGLQFVVGLRDWWRDIYSERRLLLDPYLLLAARGCQRLHPLASHFVRDDLTLQSAACASLDSWFSDLCLNLTVWFSYQVVSFRLHTRWNWLPDLLSSPCLLITTWQLVKAHGVTRNEPKIHVICYIIIAHFSISNAIPIS